MESEKASKFKSWVERQWWYIIPGLLITISSVVGIGIAVWDHYFPDAKTQISKMGLHWDNNDYSESVRNGQLDAIGDYLRGGMSPNEFYNSTDRFVMYLPIFNHTANFPEIVKLFVNSAVNFKTTNSRGKPELFAETPGDRETLEDQMFFQLAYIGPRELELTDARALIAAKASPDHLIKTAEKLLMTPGTAPLVAREARRVIAFFTRLADPQFIPTFAAPALEFEHITVGLTRDQVTAAVKAAGDIQLLRTSQHQMALIYRNPAPGGGSLNIVVGFESGPTASYVMFRQPGDISGHLLTIFEAMWGVPSPNNYAPGLGGPWWGDQQGVWAYYDPDKYGTQSGPTIMIRNGPIP